MCLIRQFALPGEAFALHPTTYAKALGLSRTFLTLLTKGLSMIPMRLPTKVRAFFARTGKVGGKARLRTMTPAQRSEAARKAAKARWSKKS